MHGSSDGQHQGDGDQSESSNDDEFWGAGASADMFVGRVNGLVQLLTDRGVIEAVPGADASGASPLDVRYVRPETLIQKANLQSVYSLYILLTEALVSFVGSVTDSICPCHRVYDRDR